MVKDFEPSEFVQTYDQTEQKFKTAWLRQWRRQETIRMIDAITFNDVVTSKTSNSIHVGAFTDFCLLIDLDVTAAPTDITIDVELSYDGARFFKLMNGPFGSLMYEDSAGDKKEAVSGKVLADYMRIKVTATGTTSSATFKLSLDVVLSG